MRVLAVVVVVVALVGCQSRPAAYGGLACGGLVLASVAVSNLADERLNQDPESTFLEQESLAGLGIMIAVISGISLAVMDDDVVETPPPSLAVTPPIASGDARPLRDGMTGVRDVVMRCGRALGITGIVRLDIAVANGTASGVVQHPREDLGGCIVTELAAVSFPRATTIDTTIEFLVAKP